MQDQGAYKITPTDQSGLIVIVATLFMTWMVLVTLIRLYMRLTMNGPLGVDDLAAFIACVLGVTNVGTIMNSISHGLGRLPEGDFESQIESAEKALYAADLFFLAGHCVAKMSICLLLRRLGREKMYLLFCKALLVVLSLWGVASILVTALKCNLTRPWTLMHKVTCPGVDTRWKAITSFDVLTEAFLLALSVYLVWSVQMSNKRKAAVIFAFAARASVIIVIIIRQVYLNDAFDSDTLMLSISDSVVTTEIVLHYSIMTATVPCLKPFVIAFNTGWGQGIRRKGGYYAQSTGSAFQSSASRGQIESVAEDERVIMPSTDSELVIHETREWAIETESIKMQPMSREGNFI